VMGACWSSICLAVLGGALIPALKEGITPHVSSHKGVLDLQDLRVSRGDGGSIFVLVKS